MVAKRFGVFLRKQAMALKTPRLLHPQVMAVLPSSSSSTGLDKSQHLLKTERVVTGEGVPPLTAILGIAMDG